MSIGWARTWSLRAPPHPASFCRKHSAQLSVNGKEGPLAAEKNAENTTSTA